MYEIKLKLNSYPDIIIGRYKSKIEAKQKGNEFRERAKEKVLKYNTDSTINSFDELEKGLKSNCNIHFEILNEKLYVNRGLFHVYCIAKSEIEVYKVYENTFDEWLTNEYNNMI